LQSDRSFAGCATTSALNDRPEKESQTHDGGEHRRVVSHPIAPWEAIVDKVFR
jgi:hypothetical protein